MKSGFAAASAQPEELTSVNLFLLSCAIYNAGMTSVIICAPGMFGGLINVCNPKNSDEKRVDRNVLS